MCRRSEIESNRISKIKQLKTLMKRGKDTTRFLAWVDRKSVAILPEEPKLKA